MRTQQDASLFGNWSARAFALFENGTFAEPTPRTPFGEIAVLPGDAPMGGYPGTLVRKG